MDNYKNALIRQVFEVERDAAWVQFVENQAKWYRAQKQSHS